MTCGLGNRRSILLSYERNSADSQEPNSQEAYARQDSNNTPKTLVNQGVSLPGGAKSGALADNSGPADSELAQLITAWPSLPEAIKAGIMAMVKAAKGTVK